MFTLIIVNALINSIGFRIAENKISFLENKKKDDLKTFLFLIFVIPFPIIIFWLVRYIDVMKVEKGKLSE